VTGGPPTKDVVGDATGAAVYVIGGGAGYAVNEEVGQAVGPAE